jgi:preprotein translocase subunit SecY
VSNNLKKNGGSIPGIRPGKPTSDFITKVLNRITLIGALFLDVVAVLPLVVNIITGSSLGSLAFGGSSLLIVVGVVLETARGLEAQMTMRHYKGFLE